MRALTLHEKISIRGILSRYKIFGLAYLEYNNAMYLIYWCTGKSIGDLPEFRKKKRTPTCYLHKGTRKYVCI